MYFYWCQIATFCFCCVSISIRVSFSPPRQPTGGGGWGEERGEEGEKAAVPHTFLLFSFGLGSFPPQLRVRTGAVLTQLRRNFLLRCAPVHVKLSLPLSLSPSDTHARARIHSFFSPFSPWNRITAGVWPERRSARLINVPGKIKGAGRAGVKVMRGLINSRFLERNISNEGLRLCLNFHFSVWLNKIIWTFLRYVICFNKKNQ